MEPQHYHHLHQQQHQQQEDGATCSGVETTTGGNSSSKAAGAAGFLCRQSSTRWIPTSDQIRILRDLYYNNGLRSPNAEQIQRISARLRQYGKIEGKNVFYWFQNHKARERQKKRLTTVDNITPTTTPTINTKTISTALSPGFPATGRSSSAFYNVGQSGSDEYGMAGGGASGSATSTPWMNQYCLSDRVMAANTMSSREIETLPLFPINAAKEEEEDEHYQTQYYYSSDLLFSHSHIKDINSNNVDNTKINQHIPNLYCYSAGQQHQLFNLNSTTVDDANAYDLAADSLELTLNSYYAPPPGST